MLKTEPSPSVARAETGRRVRIGLIGAGRIGRIHGGNIVHAVPSAELAGVCDARPEAAEALGREFGARAVADHRELLDDPAVDAVAVCSSTDTHAAIIREAARAGKHIFCEKPIALELSEIRSALEVVSRSGVLFQIGFNRRFDPQFRRVAELARTGRIGTLEVLRITSRDPSPPPSEYVKVSGGLFLDMTIHDFDMARFLTGDEVEEVFAAGAVRVDPSIGRLGDVDTAVVTLRFRGGALGVIDDSRRAAYGYDQRAELFGSKGLAAASNTAPDDVLVQDAQGRHQGPPHYFFLERYAEAYRAELREFVSCVLERRSPSPGGEDGLQAVLIGLAAKKSLKEGRPVRLAEVDEK